MSDQSVASDMKAENVTLVKLVQLAVSAGEAASPAQINLAVASLCRSCSLACFGSPDS